MSEFSWPPEQLFVTPDALHKLATMCRDSFVTTAQDLDIGADLSPLLPSLYLPLAAWLEARRREQRNALVVGVSGPQGSGKSTLVALLKAVLEVGFARRVASFSLDDIYKTKSQRNAMARAVHPLFATRGVPGTHDIALGIRTIESLRVQTAGHSTLLPAFDKAKDDRRPRSTWLHCTGKVDLVLFEGWCVGALPEADEALGTPVNQLEAQEDPDGCWRAEANRALGQEYQKLFALIDVLIMMKVDSMDVVYEGRRLQERQLTKKMRESGLPAEQWTVMSDRELNRFIMHYERLTRHILAEMPRRADMVFFLDGRRMPVRVLINKPVSPVPGQIS
jgi:D-glycerate 3-kinase